MKKRDRLNIETEDTSPKTYRTAFNGGNFLKSTNDIVTAGFRWPPEVGAHIYDIIEDGRGL